METASHVEVERSRDPQHFRNVLGRFPTGVVAVTALHDGEPLGLAVGSFSSVSLEPPLVSFGVAHTTSTWPRIRERGAFCVNVLTQEQAALCKTFATSGADKFAGLEWTLSAGGAPVLPGILAWIDCALEAEHTAGDHAIVVARVLDLDADDAQAGPLVFFRGTFGSFTAVT